MTFQWISFHEATVEDLSASTGKFVLTLTDVLTDSGRAEGSLTVAGVKSMIIDGLPSRTLTKEADDGEVLSLEYTDTEVRCFIEWKDFQNRLFVTRSYVVAGGTVSVQFAVKTERREE